MEKMKKVSLQLKEFFSLQGGFSVGHFCYGVAS
jgi:hypothetical protein